jgi:ubiquinone biosynthesis protein
MASVTRVVQSVQSIRTAIKDVGRTREIVGILVRHGFGALLARMGLAEFFSGAETGPSDPGRSLARRVRESIEELGPTFIKLGQILSTRPDLVGAELAAEFQHLQDDVPPMAEADVVAQMEQALRQPFARIFKTFEITPFASASIAQVHHAELPDGARVVIKVQRPRIRDRIQSDLNIMQFLAARAAELVPELQMMDPVGIVGEFERAINKELDFNNERINLERFARNFESFAGISVPRVYAEHCAPQVLTMEFIDGVKVTRAVTEFGLDPYPIARTLLNGLFKMLFVDGSFHGDLHPGNILVTERGEIYLIDFGLVGRLLPRQREEIIELLVGVAGEDYETIARIFFDIGIKVPGVRYDFVAFENDTIDVIDTHLTGKTLEEIEVGRFFRDLVDGCIRHQIKMPPAYTLVFKALMTVEGIGKMLSPKINLVDESRPFVEQMLKARYQLDNLMRQGIETLTTTTRFMQRLTRTAPRVLRDLELGRLTIKVESDQLAGFIREQQRATRRLVRAVVFGAAAVTGTLALDHGGQTILGINLVSFVAYAIGVSAGLPLLAQLLRR